MITNINGLNIYAKTNNGLIYKATQFETYDNQCCASIELELAAGWDYVNPDYNNVMGWVGADNFIDDCQYESVVWNIFNEGIKEALTESGYTLVDENYRKI